MYIIENLKKTKGKQKLPFCCLHCCPYIHTYLYNQCVDLGQVATHFDYFENVSVQGWGG